MIKRLEKLLGDKGKIEHHIIGNIEEYFFIVFTYDYDDNESYWRIKFRNEFLPREILISCTTNIYAELTIKKSIKIDREEKLKNIENKSKNTLVE